MENRPHLIPSLIAAAMLFGALGHWPYGYYIVLRWITFGASLFVAYHQLDDDRQWVAWIFGMIALLFNPVIPLHLSREVWAPINFLSGLGFLWIAYLPSIRKESD